MYLQEKQIICVPVVKIHSGRAFSGIHFLMNLVKRKVLLDNKHSQQPSFGSSIENKVFCILDGGRTFHIDES